MANNQNQGTEPHTAPATASQPSQPRYIMPNQMRVERVGNLTSGVTHVFPEVRGGICEYCGVVDPNAPSEYQYKLCPHYRGMELRCSYCPAARNADDVANHSTLRILEHPDKPGTLLIHCDSYDCKEAHRKRWQTANI